MKKTIATLLVGTMLSTGALSTAYASGDTYNINPNITYNVSDSQLYFFGPPSDNEDWQQFWLNLFETLNINENNEIHFPSDWNGVPDQPLVEIIFNQQNYDALKSAYADINEENEFVMTYLDTVSYTLDGKAKSRYDVHSIKYNLDGTYVNTNLIDGTTTSGTWTDEGDSINITPDSGKAFTVNFGGTSVISNNTIKVESANKITDTLIYSNKLAGFTIDSPDEYVETVTVTTENDVQKHVTLDPIQPAPKTSETAQQSTFTYIITTPITTTTTSYSVKINGKEDTPALPAKPDVVTTSKGTKSYDYELVWNTVPNPAFVFNPEGTYLEDIDVEAERTPDTITPEEYKANSINTKQGLSARLSDIKAFIESQSAWYYNHSIDSVNELVGEYSNWSSLDKLTQAEAQKLFDIHELSNNNKWFKGEVQLSIDLIEQIIANIEAGETYGLLNVEGLEEAHNDGWTGKDVTISIVDDGLSGVEAQATAEAVAPGANVEFLGNQKKSTGSDIYSYSDQINVNNVNKANPDALHVLASGSNNTDILSAPGVNIVAGDKDNSNVGNSDVKYNYIVADGTGLANGEGSKFAAAKVAGAAAILQHKYPELDAQGAKDILLATAEDLGEEGVDDVYGHGELHLGAALSPIDFFDENYVSYDAADIYLESVATNVVSSAKSYSPTVWDDVVPAGPGVQFVTQTGSQDYAISNTETIITSYTIQINGKEDTPALQPKTPITVVNVLAPTTGTEPRTQQVTNPNYDPPIIVDPVATTYLNGYNLSKANQPNKDSTDIYNDWHDNKAISPTTKSGFYYKLDTKGLQDVHNEGWDGTGVHIWINSQTDGERTRSKEVLQGVAPGAIVNWEEDNSKGFLGGATFSNSLPNADISLNVQDNWANDFTDNLMAADGDTLHVWATGGGVNPIDNVEEHGQGNNIIVIGVDDNLSGSQSTEGKAQYVLQADTGGFDNKENNKYAAAKVAGAAALLQQKFTKLTAQQTANILFETAYKSFDGYDFLKDGHGELDVGAALSPIDFFDDGEWSNWSVTNESWQPGSHWAQITHSDWTNNTAEAWEPTVTNTREAYNLAYGVKVITEGRECYYGTCVGQESKTTKYADAFFQDQGTTIESQTVANPGYLGLTDHTGYDYTLGTPATGTAYTTYINNNNNNSNYNGSYTDYYNNLNITGLQGVHNDGWQGNGVKIIFTGADDNKDQKAADTAQAVAPGATVETNSGLFWHEPNNLQNLFRIRGLLVGANGLNNEHTNSILKETQNVLNVWGKGTNHGFDRLKYSWVADSNIGVVTHNSNNDLSDVHARHVISVDASSIHSSGDNDTKYAVGKVAGAAALVQHKFPNVNAAQIKHILINTADRSFNGYNSADDGMGRLHVGAALSPIGDVF